jgi:hypothetical protein
MLASVRFAVARRPVHPPGLVDALLPQSDPWSQESLFLQWTKPAQGTKRTFGRPVAEALAAEPEASLLAAALSEDHVA